VTAPDLGGGEVDGIVGSDEDLADRRLRSFHRCARDLVARFEIEDDEELALAVVIARES
jgi:hypothetical protein